MRTDEVRVKAVAPAHPRVDAVNGGHASALPALAHRRSGLRSRHVIASQHVAVIGAGPAGLMAAEVLAQGGATVTVYDAMPSAGRKFLMAGRGGLNLTHSEPLPQFLRATARRCRICKPPSTRSRRARCATGAKRWGRRPSSAPAAGCFQKRSRPRPCCAPGCGGWIRMGVRFALRHRWTGWDGQRPPAFSNAGRTARRRGARDRAGTRRREAGRGSARMVAWVGVLAAKGVTDIAAAAGQFRLHRRLVRHFPRSLRGPAAQGCGADASARTPCAAKPSLPAPASKAARSMRCRPNCARRSWRGQATLHVALRPDLEVERSDREAVRRRKASNRCRISCARPRICRRSRSDCCRRPPRHPARRCASLSPADLARSDQRRARSAQRRRADRARDFDRGRDLRSSELDADFMLRRLPGVFAAGEMLDWEAPTGGYLLQASFATGLPRGRVR